MNFTDGAPMNRRLSSLSVRRLDKLDDIEAEVEEAERTVEALHSFLGGGADRNRILAMARQVNGHLEKLQASELDAVVTGDLSSGKAAAKDLRKQLNARVEAARASVVALHEALTKPSAAAAPDRGYERHIPPGIRYNKERV